MLLFLWFVFLVATGTFSGSLNVSSMFLNGVTFVLLVFLIILILFFFFVLCFVFMIAMIQDVLVSGNNY